MAIPEHVRKQAMDAVSNKETTAQIRAFQNSGIEASPATSFTHAETSKQATRPLTDDVRRQAMDAVSHRETTAQIRLVKDSGSISPGPTPSHKSSLIAERIAEMHKAGHDVKSVHQTITKDNFGREYGT